MAANETWTRAIAYLKPKPTDDVSEATISFSHEDLQVLRDLNNELLVAYPVDKGTSFDLSSKSSSHRHRH